MIARVIVQGSHSGLRKGAGRPTIHLVGFFSTKTTSSTSYIRQQQSSQHFRPSLQHFSLHTSAAKKLWNQYVNNNRKSSPVDLFRAIDLDSNQRISGRELQFFVESVVGKQGISAEGLQLLQDLVAESDHELEEQEFLQWLNIASLPSPASPWDDHGHSSTEIIQQTHALDRHSDHAGVLRLKAKRNSKLMNLVWDQYIESQQETSTAETVFKTIDLDGNQYISLLEIQLFFESIDHRHINLQVWNDYQICHDDKYEMNFAEFRAFLQEACSSSS
jgi:Ca2+-binding EF-hand superfamily protein